MPGGDTYVDGVRISTNPYGVNLVLLASVPPALANQEGASTPVGVLRMGWPLLKELSFLLSRHIRQFEEHSGTEVQVPLATLNGDGIGVEDWAAFWKR